MKVYVVVSMDANKFTSIPLSNVKVLGVYTDISKAHKCALELKNVFTLSTRIFTSNINAFYDIEYEK